MKSTRYLIETETVDGQVVRRTFSVNGRVVSGWRAAWAQLSIWIGQAILWPFARTYRAWRGKWPTWYNVRRFEAELNNTKH